MSPTDPYPMKTLGSLETPPLNGHAPAPVPAPAPAETPLPPALSAPPGLDTAWHVLRRRWQLILGAGLVAAVVGAAVAWFATPGKYSTSAIVHLESQNPRNGSTDPDEFLNYQRTQIAALKSYEVLNRLIVKPEIRELSEVQKHQGSEVEWLQKDLVVDSQLGPEILRVTLTGDNADDIEKILNALIPIYKEKFDSDETDKVNHRIEELKARIKDKEKEINNSTTQLDGPGRDLRTLEWRQQDLQQKITSLQIQLGLLHSEMRKDELDKADFERKRTHPAELVKELDVLEKLDQDDEIRPLRLERAQLNREMQENIRLAPTPAVGEQRAEPYRLKITNLDKEIDNLKAKNSEDIRKALQEKEVQKLNNTIADLAKQIQLREKDAEDLTKEKLAAMSAFDEVRLQLYNQRLREESSKDKGLPKERRGICWPTSRVSWRRASRRRRVSSSRSAPRCRRRGNWTRRSSSPRVPASACSAWCCVACSCSSSRSGAFTRSRTWRAASACESSAPCRSSARSAGRPRWSNSPCSNRRTRCERCCCKRLATTASAS